MQKTNAPGSSSGNFVDKTEGTPGTKITATDLNAVTHELVNAITAGGLTPSGADLEQLTKAIRNLAVPVGTIYTQLPGKATPATLYPGTTWSNISSAFPGAFFRAEGGKSSAFGAGVQTDAFQGHTHQRTDAKRGDNDGTPTVPQWAGTVAPYNGTVTFGDPATDGVNGTPRTADETRPTNFTVRIWERTA